MKKKLHYLRCLFFKILSTFVPNTKISISTDAGKTYTECFTAIQYRKTVFVKFEIFIRKIGLLYWLFSNNIAFSIIFPAGFVLDKGQHKYTCELVSTSNCKHDLDTGTRDAGDNKLNYTVTVESEFKEKSAYTITVSQIKKLQYKFLILLCSKQNINAEVVFRVAYDKGQTGISEFDKCGFELFFNNTIHETYRKTICLGFVDYLGEPV